MNLNDIRSKMSYDLGLLEQELKTINIDVPVHSAVLAPLIFPGKKLRAMLLILFAKSLGGNELHYIRAAAAIEMLHVSTLVHDDVVDDSDMRRGVSTANATIGNKASVLMGDYLLSQAFKKLVELGNLDMLTVIARATEVITRGELHQLMIDDEIQYKEYLEIITSKTAELFASACEIGAICANASMRDRANARTFGMNFGVAFQMMDDLLDYTGSQAHLGKNPGDDFREGKITLPLILLRAQHPELYRRALQERSQKVFREIIHYIPLERYIAHIKDYISDAHLSISEDFLHRDALFDLSNSILLY